MKRLWLNVEQNENTVIIFRICNIADAACYRDTVTQIERHPRKKKKVGRKTK